MHNTINLKNSHYLVDGAAEYKPHIDGLRTLSVVLVILFHLKVPGFNGGFIGVDIFFVISGFLITGIIRRDITIGRFTIQEFYRRRIVRIVPALVATLLMVLPIGFLLDTQIDFDFLGRQVFYASIGLSNILFSTRTDYFAAETPQLIHTWSLGVEEQFYVFFPILMLIVNRWFRKNFLVFIVSTLFIFSVLPFFEEDPFRRYFLPQYRAFELLLGALLTFAPTALRLAPPIIPALGLALIALSVVVISPETPFPGPLTWLPLIGAALVIVSERNGAVVRLLSLPAMVHVGLISYPLYLVHQPLIFYLHRLDMTVNPVMFSILAMTSSYVLALGVHRAVELPFRRIRGADVRRRNIVAAVLVSMLLGLATMGFHIARNSGWPWRFDMLNPFAAEVAAANIFSFDAFFKSGFVTNPTSEGALLVIGDSIGQQYAYPLAHAMGLDPDAVDTATRNGCVMTKGVTFQEIVSRVSCNGVRDALYADDKRYDVIALTQYWRSETHARRVTNFPVDQEMRVIPAWEGFLRQTLDALSPRAGTVILFGWHPVVKMNKEAMAPSVYLDKEVYIKSMNSMYIDNNSETINQNNALHRIAKDYNNVEIINPFEIFCESADLNQCTLHDGTFSYFRDSIHINVHSTDFVAGRLKTLLSRREVDPDISVAPE